MIRGFGGRFLWSLGFGGHNTTLLIANGLRRIDIPDRNYFICRRMKLKITLEYAFLLFWSVSQRCVVIYVCFSREIARTSVLWHWWPQQATHQCNAGKIVICRIREFLRVIFEYVNAYAWPLIAKIHTIITRQGHTLSRRLRALSQSGR